MARAFDAGYGAQPFRDLVEDYPGPPTYPQGDFRVEWGPVFHRGRLDGSARVLVVGQDPAQHETIARRILVGEAGHRLQGFLFKLGIESSYVLVNTYLYCLFGKTGNKHRDNKEIAAYRNRWLDALFAPKKIDAVVALGSLAESAWETWKATPAGQGANARFVRITHPTQPESSGLPHGAAIKALLENWNAGLQKLHPLPNRDKQRALKLYGDAFAAGEKVPIPDIDMPAGSPEWMRLNDGWADRGPGGSSMKRRKITVTVPKEVI
ncbi:MAG TPA: uracil-DNA glycosylase family protein [Gaiellaceae bacterium]|nr:uracil-DNA glycosylase family protein [Gaiellaceae bacterium]